VTEPPKAPRIVSFRQMKDGTRADYLLLDESERSFGAALGVRVLAAMRGLDHSLEGYPVSRLGHSLQAATRAETDGADEELVLAALLHDIGDELAPYNHAELAASVLRPYVRPEVSWIVEQHGLFQTYYYVHHLGGDRHARERLRGHPWYDACAHFCEAWDQSSFDPDYPSRPLTHFEPLVQRIFSRPPHDPRYVAAGAVG
jgi:predicted HD phosphohydrolase